MKSCNGRPRPLKAQAKTYAETLLQAIQALEAGPEVLGTRARDDIGPGLRTLHLARRGRKARHFIIFRVGAGQVIDVLRLLHDSMDLARHGPFGGLKETRTDPAHQPAPDRVDDQGKSIDLVVDASAPTAILPTMDDVPPHMQSKLQMMTLLNDRSLTLIVNMTRSPWNKNNSPSSAWRCSFPGTSRRTFSP